MRREAWEWVLLMGKSVLLVVGGILLMAGLVDLIVGGPSARTFRVLLVGALLAIPPIAFAFRDALREARKGRR